MSRPPSTITTTIVAVAVLVAVCSVAAAASVGSAADGPAIDATTDDDANAPDSPPSGTTPRASSSGSGLGLLVALTGFAVAWAGRYGRR